MTQEDLNQLAEEHIDNEEYEVMFRDKQPIWVVNNCYQAGFKKALELVLEGNMITEIHDCATLKQLLNWL